MVFYVKVGKSHLFIILSILFISHSIFQALHKFGHLTHTFISPKKNTCTARKKKLQSNLHAHRTKYTHAFRPTYEFVVTPIDVAALVNTVRNLNNEFKSFMSLA